MRRLEIGLSSIGFSCLLAATASAQPGGAPPPAPDPAPQPAPATDVVAAAPQAAPPAPAPSVALTATPETFSKNAIYAELGGTGGFYTVNYERFLRKDASIRAGFMYMSMSATASGGGGTSTASATWLSIPLMFQYLGLASGSHALELAGGINLMYMSGAVSTFDATSSNDANASTMIPVGAAAVGYRYSDPTGGFVFRAGYTPLFFVTTEVKQMFHWGGMSFGYRFQ